ncbi:GNAT family N-acetyltransferase [Rufibacter roseus]|uniref:GNAT family N-acetyltransferase n=1 Tax=Rufibacter roseus TaxID=1567108 RepID=A0ABW2DKI8_9BACT|nr:GNAT family protein [Rufibacter roseus]
MDFKLRPWQIDDLDSVVKHGNNINIARFMTDAFPHPYTEENGRSFIEFATKDKPIHIFAIDINGEAVGGIGVHPQADIHHRNAELGYWLSEEYWGKGLMSKAVLQMIDFAFQSFEIDRVFARPFGTNLASQRVLEKVGFSLEAHFEKTLVKNGELLDELVYAIRRV